MAPASPANDFEPTLSAEAIWTLARMHLRKPLALALAGALPVENSVPRGLDDPQWVAGELLRLALIGAVAEGEHPEAPVRLVLGFARHLLERP